MPIEDSDLPVLSDQSSMGTFCAAKDPTPSPAFLQAENASDQTGNAQTDLNPCCMHMPTCDHLFLMLDTRLFF